MKMKKIIRALEMARDEYDYGYVEVLVPGQTEAEIIINSSLSLDNKIDFYKKAYDENGVHCMNSAVIIVGAGAVQNMSRIALTDVDDEKAKPQKICPSTGRECCECMPGGCGD